MVYSLVKFIFRKIECRRRSGAKEKVGAYVNGDDISGGSGGSAELPDGDWSADLPSKI